MNGNKPIEKIYLLLVDDNPEFLIELQKGLKDFGYEKLDTARSMKEANEQLQEKTFDVIIADMRMEENDSGFAVIDKVKEGNISSISIIFTANETVEDCRRAFKSGVWDFISKNWKGDIIEILHKSIQEALLYYSSWGNPKDRKWIHDNLGYLLDQYQGLYIGVINNRVVASGKEKNEVEEEIRKLQHPHFLTIIEKIDYTLFEQLSNSLLVFVEGPTDVKYINKAFKIFQKEHFLKNIIVDTIGNKIGDRGGGARNLKNGYYFLEENNFTSGKVLFLFDQDVSDQDLPYRGEEPKQDNRYIGRIAEYDKDKKGIEFLFPTSIFEEGVEKGFVKKTETITTTKKEGRIEKINFKVEEKIGFCDWICDQRKNGETDFEGFRNVVEMIEKLSSET